MEQEPSTEFIELEPYIHQVGGHSFMLSLDETAVCKPLVERELQFYQTMPDGVQKFIPRFYGIIKVTTVEKEDGYVSFLAKPSECFATTSEPRQIRNRLKRTGSIEIVDCHNKFQDDQIAEGSDMNESTGMNPWVVKCHRDNIHSLIKSFTSENTTLFKDFIILENLTWKFSLPCILDLKMGTRQYGDAASLAKKQSKMFKVVSTTSAKLGLRVGGMQVYQVPTKHFLCRNKFYGRTLTISGFQQALIQFLHNGVRFRSDVLPVLIHRLEELANILGRQEAIRFYTTSLLLLYEGEDDTLEMSNTEEPETDKAESIYKYFKSMDRQDSFKKLKLPVNDLLRKTSSAESLVSYPDTVAIDEINKITLQHRRSSTNLDVSSIPSENNSSTSSNSTIFEDCISDRKCSKYYIQQFTRSRTFSNKSETGSLTSSEPRVDVRMIDFAHCTNKDDAVVYTGPDRGFLFGLDKLINMLKAIENDYG